MANDLFTNYTTTMIYEESAYGTDAVDTVVQADAAALVFQELESVGPTLDITYVEPVRRRNHQSGIPHKPIKNNIGWSIAGPILGAVAPGTTPNPAIRELFKSAGLAEALSGGTSATYTPTVNANTASASIWHFARMADTADTHRMIYGVGMRGNIDFLFNSATDEAKFQYDGVSANFPDSSDAANFNGWSEDLAFFNSSGELLRGKDGALLTPSPYASGEAFAAGACVLNQTGVLTVDSQAVEITGINLNLNWSVNVKQVQGDTNGVLTSKVFLTRGGRIGGTIEVAETGAGFEKLIDLMLSGAEVSATYVLNNGTTGSDRITLTIPTLQVQTGTSGDNSGLGTWSFPFFCNENNSVTGDDDFTLVWDQVP